MKALSLWQPWAHAVVHFGKTIENRVKWTGCNYRGPLAIHASKGYGSATEFDEACETIADVLSQTGRGDVWKRFVAKCLETITDRSGNSMWAPAPTLPRGGVIGRANVVGVVKREPITLFNQSGFRALTTVGIRDLTDVEKRWHFGAFALVLADQQPVAFLPWKGKQGFFDVPDDQIVVGQ